MLVLSKIVMIICILLLIILSILLIVILFPFAYNFDMFYAENEIKANLKYFIFNFSANLKWTNKIEYYLKFGKKVLFDSNLKNKSQTPTKSQKKEFDNKEELIKKVNETNVSAKELFIDAKKLESKIENDKETKINNNSKQVKQSIDINDFLEKIKKLIPYDMFYVIKCIVRELSIILNNLKPSKYHVDIEYGLNDPYLTGVSYAILSQITAITDEDSYFKPNFKTNEMNAHLHLHKRIILLLLIIPILRLLLDKKFRKIVFKKKVDKA